MAGRNRLGETRRSRKTREGARRHDCRHQCGRRQKGIHRRDRGWLVDSHRHRTPHRGSEQAAQQSAARRQGARTIEQAA